MSFASREKPQFALLCGAPHSGKSVLTRHIIYQAFAARSVDYCLVFTQTPEDYAFLPQGFVHTSYEHSTLARLMRIQQERPDRVVLLIFDDMLGAVGFQHSLVKNLVSRYRHLNINLLIATQYINSVPPIVRETASIVAIFKQQTDAAVSAAFSSFGGRGFRRKADFHDWLDSHTNDYVFIIYNPRVTNQNFSELYRQARVNFERLPRHNITF